MSDQVIRFAPSNECALTCAPSAVVRVTTMYTAAISGIAYSAHQPPPTVASGVTHSTATSGIAADAAGIRKTARLARDIAPW